MKRELSAAKEQYMERLRKKTKQVGHFGPIFKGIKGLQNVGKPKNWTVFDLYPGLSHEEAVESAAKSFNKISNEFAPLPERQPETEKSEPFSYLQETVAACLCLAPYCKILKYSLGYDS